jgi:hypothetical protein
MGEFEVVPEQIGILGKCVYNALSFEINQSREADKNTRLKKDCLKKSPRRRAHLCDREEFFSIFIDRESMR